MSLWTILVYVDSSNNHFKFWSYTSDYSKVSWGRIGTNGIIRVFPRSVIERRISEKYREGYKLLEEDSETNYPTDSLQEIKDWWESEIEERRIEERELRHQEELERHQELSSSQRHELRTSAREELSEESEIEEAPEPITRERTIPSNVSFNTPNVKSYKTDKSGYIKNMRNDYTRDIFSDFSDYHNDIKVILLRNLMRSSRRSRKFKSAESYFNRISSDSVYNKPDKFADLRKPSRPTAYIMFHKSTAIAIYCVNTKLGSCDFLALKSNIKFRISILKLIIKRTSRVSQKNYIRFKIKNKKLKKEIQKIASYYSEQGGWFVYKNRDIESGISLRDDLGGVPRPTRWIK